MSCWCRDFDWSRRAFSLINFSERYDKNSTKEVKTKSLGAYILVLPLCIPCTFYSMGVSMKQNKQKIKHQKEQKQKNKKKTRYG